MEWFITVTILDFHQNRIKSSKIGAMLKIETTLFFIVDFECGFDFMHSAFRRILCIQCAKYLYNCYTEIIFIEMLYSYCDAFWVLLLLLTFYWSIYYYFFYGETVIFYIFIYRYAEHKYFCGILNIVDLFIYVAEHV